MLFTREKLVEEEKNGWKISLVQLSYRTIIKSEFKKDIWKMEIWTRSGLILLEKSQKTINSIAVSPVTPADGEN